MGWASDSSSAARASRGQGERSPIGPLCPPATLQGTPPPWGRAELPFPPIPPFSDTSITMGDLFRFQRDGGSGPVRRFRRRVSLRRRDPPPPTSTGKVWMIALQDICNILRWGRENSNSGSAPLTPFPTRLIRRRRGNTHHNPGRAPESPAPGRYIPLTRPSGSQVNPMKEQ